MKGSLLDAVANQLFLDCVLSIVKALEERRGGDIGGSETPRWECWNWPEEGWVGREGREGFVVIYKREGWGDLRVINCAQHRGRRRQTASKRSTQSSCSPRKFVGVVVGVRRSLSRLIAVK